MIRLTITPDSSSEFTAVVTGNDGEMNRRHYADGRNCSYSKESADMAKPYVADAIQSVINRYGVQDMEVEGQNPMFEEMFCKDLTTHTRYPDNKLPELRTARIKEQREKLFGMSDRELCEAVVSHFDSHPAQDKDLKTQASEALKANGDTFLPTYQRDLMVQKFACMRIQEATIKGGRLECDPQLLEHDTIATKNAATVYKIDASLRKCEDGSVSVMGKQTDGGEVKLGSLPDTFLRNNPMNVDGCDAEVELTDFSNGKMKNLKVRVVTNSDEMSGDIIELNEDMLAGLDEDFGLEQ